MQQHHFQQLLIELRGKKNKAAYVRLISLLVQTEKIFLTNFELADATKPPIFEYLLVKHPIFKLLTDYPAVCHWLTQEAQQEMTVADAFISALNNQAGLRACLERLVRESEVNNSDEARAYLHELFNFATQKSRYLDYSAVQRMVQHKLPFTDITQLNLIALERLRDIRLCDLLMSKVGAEREDLLRRLNDASAEEIELLLGLNLDQLFTAEFLKCRNSHFVEEPVEQLELAISNLYENQAAVYFKPEQQSLADFLISPNWMALANQFASLIRHIKQIIQQSSLKPHHKTSQYRILDTFIFNLNSRAHFKIEAQPVIYTSTKYELEKLVVKLRSAGVDMSIKERVVSRLLDQLDTCGGGVASAISASYQDICDLQDELNIIASTKLAIVKQVATEIARAHLVSLGDTMGNHIHLAEALTMLVAEELALPLSQDVDIEHGEQYLQPNNVVEPQFSQALRTSLTPIQLLRVLSDRLLPRLKQEWDALKLSKMGKVVVALHERTADMRELLASKLAAGSGITADKSSFAFLDRYGIDTLNIQNLFPKIDLELNPHLVICTLRRRLIEKGIFNQNAISSKKQPSTDSAQLCYIDWVEGTPEMSQFTWVGASDHQVQQSFVLFQLTEVGSVTTDVFRKLTTVQRRDVRRFLYEAPELRARAVAALVAKTSSAEEVWEKFNKLKKLFYFNFSGNMAAVFEPIIVTIHDSKRWERFFYTINENFQAQFFLQLIALSVTGKIHVPSFIEFLQQSSWLADFSPGERQHLFQQVTPAQLTALIWVDGKPTHFPYVLPGPKERSMLVLQRLEENCIERLGLENLILYLDPTTNTIFHFLNRVSFSIFCQWIGSNIHQLFVRLLVGGYRALLKAYPVLASHINNYFDTNFVLEEWMAICQIADLRLADLMHNHREKFLAVASASQFIFLLDILQQKQEKAAAHSLLAAVFGLTDDRIKILLPVYEDLEEVDNFSQGLVIKQSLMGRRLMANQNCAELREFVESIPAAERVTILATNIVSIRPLFRPLSAGYEHKHNPFAHFSDEEQTALLNQVTPQDLTLCLVREDSADSPYTSFPLYFAADERDTLIFSRLMAEDFDKFDFDYFCHVLAGQRFRNPAWFNFLRRLTQAQFDNMVEQNAPTAEAKANRLNRLLEAIFINPSNAEYEIVYQAKIEPYIRDHFSLELFGELYAIAQLNARRKIVQNFAADLVLALSDSMALQNWLAIFQHDGLIVDFQPVLHGRLTTQQDKIFQLIPTVQALEEIILLLNDEEVKVAFFVEFVTQLTRQRRDIQVWFRNSTDYLRIFNCLPAAIFARLYHQNPLVLSLPSAEEACDWLGQLDNQRRLALCWQLPAARCQLFCDKLNQYMAALSNNPNQPESVCSPDTLYQFLSIEQATPSAVPGFALLLVQTVLPVGELLRTIYAYHMLRYPQHRFGAAHSLRFFTVPYVPVDLNDTRLLAAKAQVDMAKLTDHTQSDSRHVRICQALGLNLLALTADLEDVVRQEIR